MDEAKALAKVRDVKDMIDTLKDVYNARWYEDRDELAGELAQLDDRVRAEVRMVREIASAIGSPSASDLVEHPEGQFGGHPWKQARKAIIELEAELAQQEELAEIVGPAGPKLAGASMHRVVWRAAAELWDDGHYRQAVQTAAQALEGHLQGAASSMLTGEKLAALFSVNPPQSGESRLRVQGIAEDSPTWNSVHEGAAALVRGAMMAVRNLVSHPGWDDPTADEALEMLAIMSYVARLVDRSDLVKDEGGADG